MFRTLITKASPGFFRIHGQHNELLLVRSFSRLLPQMLLRRDAAAQPAGKESPSPTSLAAFLSVVAMTMGTTFFRNDGDMTTPSSRYSMALCEESNGTNEEKTFDFASVGVNEADVDALVKHLLKDKSINIPLLPDRLEAKLYKSTILLTLNAVYSLLKKFQGARLLSHEFNITIDRDDPAQQTSRLAKALTEGTTESVNDDILQQVATRLLANPAVNSTWIPDKLEHQIYFACLQVMFRVTAIVLSTLKVRICGHDLTLHLAFEDGGLESAALAAISSEDSTTTTTLVERKMTPIDLDLLTSIAQQAGVDDESNPDYWWNRIFTRSDFVRQLHVSLYGLVLGLLDDLFLGQLKIQILSDAIRLDLVPAKNPYDYTTAFNAENNDEGESSASNQSSIPASSEGVSVESFAAASFAAGVGVGVTLMAVLSNSQR